jgi:hypothetical protein
VSTGEIPTTYLQHVKNVMIDLMAMEEHLTKDENITPIDANNQNVRRRMKTKRRNRVKRKMLQFLNSCI